MGKIKQEWSLWLKSCDCELMLIKEISSIWELILIEKAVIHLIVICDPTIKVYSLFYFIDQMWNLFNSQMSMQLSQT